MIPKHVQVGMIELVNALLGIVANTYASPVQCDPKLDGFLWHVVEETGAEFCEEQKEKFCFAKRNTVVFLLSTVLNLGEVENLSMKYTLITAL